MPTDQRTFGDVGTKLLFENERIRVWEMRLAPGERSQLHEHHHDEGGDEAVLGGKGPLGLPVGREEGAAAGRYDGLLVAGLPQDLGHRPRRADGATM